MQYIILDGKTPTHKFKNGEGTKTWEEAKDFDNVALVVPQGYVVIDIDTDSDAEIMLKLVDALQIKTNVLKTSRGIHCWFKTVGDDVKCYTKERLAIGIYADRKVGGRNAYVKIKSDGAMRKWIKKDLKMSDVEELPAFLRTVRAPGDKFSFKGMSDGDGRNQELFNYIVYLQTKGFTREEIKKIINIINEYVFADPLDEYEIETITRDDAFKPDEEIEEQMQKSKKSGFSHIDVAEEIIKNHKLLKFNNTIYEYSEGYYQPAQLLRRYIREAYFGIKNSQIAEVVSYICDMKEIKREDIKLDPYIINVNNTRLDVRTGKCLPFNSDIIEFDRLPVTYDPSAYCADLDKMLNRVFMSDHEVINLFEECIGAILIKHARFQKAFLFFGSGSNGKSTILNIIKKLLGMNNYSSLALEKVTDRFNTAELENKLANIGDDIDNVVIKDTGTLKKLFSGDMITVEHKGERPYKLAPYATHIYSANNIPRSFDKTQGFYRRWLMIPFNATFTTDDEDYDPLIEDKVTSPEALSYLLNIGLRGAQRLITQGQFTEPAVVKNALETYMTENSTVLSWIDDKELDIDYFLERSRDHCYSDFCDWCKVSGIKNSMVTGKKTFFKEVIQKFDFEEKAKQKADGKRYFIIKI